MPARSLFRSALHEHAEPARRVLGAAELPPDSEELARLLAADPAPEVRIAAAGRCANLATLAAAWRTESDAAVRVALASALVQMLSETPDAAGARGVLEADSCTDAIRTAVARSANDADRRAIAIAAIRDEQSLVELAQAAALAETRMAAAQRVHTPEALRKLADAAKDKDRGVARLARQRVHAMEDRSARATEADAILAQMEALTGEPGPILSPLVDLDRRWQALELADDPARIARREALRQILHARFEREHDEARTRARFDGRLGEWIGALAPPATAEGLAGLRAELTAFRDEARSRGDAAARDSLDRAEQRIASWEQEREAVAIAEALVVEAEQLAAGTSIDHASLPERWQALDRAHRTPDLTRRFEAAVIVVEQRRLEQIRTAQQQENAARKLVHDRLHAAEQALLAGNLHAARAAADGIRMLKAAAGVLPKPTLQRLGRLAAQLAELERWESFGQHQARIQLCERAEAVATQTPDPPRLAVEVRKLREEWKALDQQHAGVPKSLWERFDRACEEAYAPAARHFAQQAAQRKQARKQREEFIAAAAVHAPTLLVEPCDPRAIERWVRDTDRAWREGDLGSVEPGAWKKLDARLAAALAPLRDVLASARERAKADRQALIAEVELLLSKAMERDVPSKVRAIQARWQEQAKAMSLPQRDERTLWERFRTACDAVFEARQSQRKAGDERRRESAHALEQICAQLEQLAQAADVDDANVRRALRDLQAQWNGRIRGIESPLPGLESRFRNAKTAVETALSARARSQEAAAWQTLAQKELVCEELDRLVRSSPDPAQAEARSAATLERWAALPALEAAWEKQMIARRDGALRALKGAADAGHYLAGIEQGVEVRRQCLLELEMLLALDTPAEFQAGRLALQVRRLRERFQGQAAPGAANAGSRLLAWCATPGVADACDRERVERVFSKLQHGGKGGGS